MKRLVLVLAVLLVLPSSALAAGWKGGGTIFPDGQSGDGPLQATVDDSGAALFAFPRPLPDGGLFVRSRPRGGPIAPRAAIESAHPFQSDLASNARGEAVVTLTDSPQGNYPPSRLIAALRRPGKPFDQPQTIVDGQSICDSAVAAISKSGYAFVVFTAYMRGWSCLVFVSVRAPGSTHFDAPVALASTSAQDPQVAVDDRGNALIAWVDADGDGVRVARYLAGFGFLDPQQLGIKGEESGAPSFGPLLLRVSGPTGAAIIAYPSRGFDKRPAAAIGSTRNGFDRVRLLAGPSSFLGQRIDAAAGADGTLALVWRGGERGGRRVKIARVGPGAESITHLDTNTISDLHAAEVAVAIADDGRVTVAWSRLIAHGKKHAVEAATCAPSKPLREGAAAVFQRRARLGEPWGRDELDGRGVRDLVDGQGDRVGEGGDAHRQVRTCEAAAPRDSLRGPTPPPRPPRRDARNGAAVRQLRPLGEAPHLRREVTYFSAAGQTIR